LVSGTQEWRGLWESHPGLKPKTRILLSPNSIDIFFASILFYTIWVLPSVVGRKHISVSSVNNLFGYLERYYHVVVMGVKYRQSLADQLILYKNVLIHVAATPIVKIKEIFEL
jgi:hypothetical protein